MMSLQEHLDHVASRVATASLAGALAGVTTAAYRGSPIGRTVALTAVSWGMVATACFSVERLASVAFVTIANDHGLEDRSTLFTRQNAIASHVVGGAVGGGFIGLLYGNRPLQGALLLTPVLGAIGFGQELFEDERRGRSYQSSRVH
jgi:hypothetical protein